MKIVVDFESFSAHHSNKDAINLSFRAEDGTTASLAVGMAALSGLHLGKTYEIEIKEPVEPENVPRETSKEVGPVIEVEGHAVAGDGGHA